MGNLVAILDVGKTNTKLLAVDAISGDIVAKHERPSTPIHTELGIELDVHGTETWLRTTLASSSWRDQVSALVPIAHGAAAVLLDEHDQVLAAPDYENPLFDSVADAYRLLRDDFSHTLSPLLPLGLNLGRQLYWLETQQPMLFGRCKHILTYAQYWSFRLSGIKSCELTSLGCHTDLWQPLAAKFSTLATTRGWARLCAPVRRAMDTLGPVAATWATGCQLNPECAVVCGIHDSNASYLTHVLNQKLDKPFTMVSSGTWTILMARGANLQQLSEPEDMLANVDAFGHPVATARFPGGREYAAIAGTAPGIEPTANTINELLDLGSMALPSFTDSGGPFAGRVGQLVQADTLTGTQRHALAALYVALMTDYVLDRLSAVGNVVIDGPLAGNALYIGVLAQLRPQQRVISCDSRLGIAHAAVFLATNSTPPTQRPSVAVPSLTSSLLQRYRQRWRQLVTS